MKVLTLAVFQIVLLAARALAVLRYCNESDGLPASESELKKRLYYTREAELMALEATGTLLPDPDLVAKIRYDMKVIRSTFPVVANISHRKKWSVGKLRFQNVAPEDILEISQSEYGPVKIRQLNPRYRAVETSMNITYITFSKPYHPVVLAQRLEESFGISGDPIRSIFQDGDDTLYMHSENNRVNQVDMESSNDVNNTENRTNNSSITINANSNSSVPVVNSTSNSPATVYTFIRGKGKCFISCENKRYWHFMVQCANQRHLDVTLMQEYNVNLKPTSNLSSIARSIRK